MRAICIFVKELSFQSSASHDALVVRSSTTVHSFLPYVKPFDRQAYRVDRAGSERSCGLLQYGWTVNGCQPIISYGRCNDAQESYHARKCILTKLVVKTSSEEKTIYDYQWQSSILVQASPSDTYNFCRCMKASLWRYGCHCRGDPPLPLRRALRPSDSRSSP